MAASHASHSGWLAATAGRKRPTMPVIAYKDSAGRHSLVLAVCRCASSDCPRQVMRRVVLIQLRRRQLEGLLQQQAALQEAGCCMIFVLLYSTATLQAANVAQVAPPHGRRAAEHFRLMHQSRCSCLPAKYLLRWGDSRVRVCMMPKLCML